MRLLIDHVTLGLTNLLCYVAGACEHTHRYCNVPPPRGRARLHLAAFLGHSQPPQTNTLFFCARLTLEFFIDRLPEKKLQLVGMSLLLILLSPGPGVTSSPP